VSTKADIAGPATERANGPSVDSPRQVLWDAVRAIAVVRVVAWHTWRWWPLSWFAAMPAMFFVSGVFLDRSLERRGGDAVRRRLRRLLIPYWVYAFAAVMTMVVMGWRPSVSALLPWVVPLVDPIGSDDAPGLWIPLWYLRAYLWFLLAAPLLVRLVRRFGWFVPGSFAMAVVVEHAVGASAPIAVRDFLAYGVLVTAGLHVSGSAGTLGAGTLLVHRRVLIVIVALCSAVAVGFALRIGPVVNADHRQLVLVGTATIAGVMLLAGPLARFGSGVGGRPLEWITQRALSIYLWQGFGLLAADLLVTQRRFPAFVDAVLAGVVVFGVTFALAAVAVRIEDFAARRRVRSSSGRAVFASAAAAVCVSVAVLTPIADGVPTLPPSGAAALAAADAIESALSDADVPVGSRSRADGGRPAPSRGEVLEALVEAIDDHTQRFGPNLERRGVDWLTVIVRRDVDERPMAVGWRVGGDTRIVPADDQIVWFSNAKTATAIWLLDLARDGVVALDDPVGLYLPEVPHGDLITLHHLARHQSGIPPSADTAVAEDGRRDIEREIDRIDVGDDVRRWMAGGELVSEPGEQWNYSRVGYALLAWALERASNEPWQAAMKRLAAAAGIALEIDEERAPPGTSNRHPGEGSYYGALYAGGGLISTQDDFVDFFHWAFTEYLGDDEIDVMTSADPRRVLAYFGTGLVIACPCSEVDGVVRGTRFGNGGGNGWWRHDPVTGTTVLVAVPRTSDADGFIGEVLVGELENALFDAADG
jgi:CubicO group peptidase (beta-lactamase class C family)/fucose 4-O-acetylase-like acetyltransferase